MKTGFANNSSLPPVSSQWLINFKCLPLETFSRSSYKTVIWFNHICKATSWDFDCMALSLDLYLGDVTLSPVHALVLVTWCSCLMTLIVIVYFFNFLIFCTSVGGGCVLVGFCGCIFHVWYTGLKAVAGLLIPILMLLEQMILPGKRHSRNPQLLMPLASWMLPQHGCYSPIVWYWEHRTESLWLFAMWPRVSGWGIENWQHLMVVTWFPQPDGTSYIICKA